MIPELDENDYLPPGIHQASLDEAVSRFGVALISAKPKRIRCVGWHRYAATLASRES